MSAALVTGGTSFQVFQLPLPRESEIHLPASLTTAMVSGGRGGEPERRRQVFVRLICVQKIEMPFGKRLMKRLHLNGGGRVGG